MSSPLAAAKRIVIKIGSSLLVNADGLNHVWLAALAQDVAAHGRETVIVSSGAVALGRQVLKLAPPLRLEQKQAAAAAGQSRLMRAYEAAFEPTGRAVAQALLTPDDTERRRRWLNARATFETLITLGATPIVNENDTVATQELRYGDNDRLAARVAQMVSADALILFSDVDGLYDRDPRGDPAARLLPYVEAITPEIEAMGGGANIASGVGTGGMRTKIEAAKIATAAGCAVVITRGQALAPLTRLLDGAPCTWFAPTSTPRAAYKAWIAGSLAPRGGYGIDAGAAAAVAQGKSLLAAGVRAIEGQFEKGDAVRIIAPDGREIARGLTRYDAADARRIQGLRSGAIEAALGWPGGPEMVHADDLAIGA